MGSQSLFTRGMIKYSESLILVWKISSIEARNLSASFLEPQHFFLGLLKSVDINLSSISQFLEFDTPKLAEIARDLSDVRMAFDRSQIESTPMRRRLRKIEIENKDITLSEKKLRRSSEARAIFKFSEAYVGDGIVKPIHILSIISESQIPSILKVLDYHQNSISSLLNESTLIAMADLNKSQKFHSSTFSDFINLVQAYGWKLDWNRTFVNGVINWHLKISKNDISRIIHVQNIAEAITELSEQITKEIQ